MATSKSSKKRMLSTLNISNENYDLGNVSDNAESTNDDKSETNNNDKKIKWSYENEQILVEWCDIAQCYKWLNSKAHSKYSYRHAWFTIPAITLSTISGTASFAQSNIPVPYQRYAPMIIGTINILIGILTTIQQYLKISELNEAHRVSAISWDKFARNIRIELAKDPNERMDAKSFIKISRQEFDRLMETSPAIPSDIIRQFKETFEGQDPMLMCSDQLFCCIKTFFGNDCIPGGPIDASGQKISLTDYELREKEKRDRLTFFKNLKKPDICDIIVSAEEYRFKPTKNQCENTTATINTIENIVQEQPSDTELLLRETLKILTEHQKREKEEDEKRIIEKYAEQENEKNHLKKHKYISNFIDLFIKNRERQPNISEIKDYFNINTDYEVTDSIIDEYYVNMLL